MKKRIYALLIMFAALPLFSSVWSKRAFSIIETENAKKILHEMETNYSFLKYKRGTEKENILMAALEADRPHEIISLLLRGGISPDEKTRSKKTALMYACEHSSDDYVIEEIIKHGALSQSKKRKRILAQDKEGNNCFDYAALNKKNSHVTAILLKYADMPTDEAETEAEPADEEPEAETEPEAAISAEPIPETAPVAAVPVEVFATEHNQQDEADFIPDEHSEGSSEQDGSAQSYNDTAEADSALIDLSTLPAPDYQEESIYLYDYAKIAPEHERIPERLGEQENTARKFIPDCNRKDANGRTKLMYAAKKGDATEIDNLIFSGAEIDARDTEGWTALMYAARFQKNPEISRILLENGADAHLRNNYGLTPLLLAAGYSESAEVVSLFLEDCQPGSDEAREALAYAISNANKVSVLQSFVDSAVPLNVPYNGKTPLMVACETNKNTDIIEWLLKNGASKYQIETTTGRTAYDYAKKNRKLKHNDVFWSLNPEATAYSAAENMPDAF